MRIRLKTRFACPEGNYPSGSEINLDEKKAKGLIAGGYAVSLEPEKETKVVTKPKKSKRAVK